MRAHAQTPLSAPLGGGGRGEGGHSAFRTPHATFQDPEDVDLLYALGLAPEDAVAYFRAKGSLLSWDWQEMLAEAHAKAFTVAKVARMDVLRDIREIVDKAIAEGVTFQNFQRELEPRLRAKGWWGEKFVARPDGTVEKILEGSPRRLRTIYETNLQTAYNAGRWKAFQANKADRPYLQYIAVLDSRTRPAHRALHGKVFPIDDPFWDTHTPPLGYNCRCRTRALNQADVERLGVPVETGEDRITWEDRLVSRKNGEEQPVAVYRDPITGEQIATEVGWSTNPGAAAEDVEAYAWRKATRMPPDIRSRFWSEMVRAPWRQQFYEQFLEGVLERNQDQGRTIAIGWMEEEIYRAIQAKGIPLPSPVLAASDKRILHSIREAKAAREAALTLEELRRLPASVRNPKAVLWDRDDPALLYVTGPATGGATGGAEGDKQIKFVARVDYRLKKGERTNLLVTTGKVARYNLNPPRYKPLWGEL